MKKIKLSIIATFMFIVGLCASCTPTTEVFENDKNYPETVEDGEIDDEDI